MLQIHLEKNITSHTAPSLLELSEDEQEHLFELIHKGVHSARVITRARILSKLAKGHTCCRRPKTEPLLGVVPTQN